MNLFTYHFRVPFDQLDPGGVLFFGHLFSWAHRAYEGFLTQMDQGLESLLGRGHHLLPLVHAEADYLQPLRLNDAVQVTIRVEKVGRSSFILAYDFQRNGERAATARTVHACLCRETGRSCPLPNALAAALAFYASEQE